LWDGAILPRQSCLQAAVSDGFLPAARILTPAVGHFLPNPAVFGAQEQLLGTSF
jgi:hypothetical protein